jgi:hypothetical protein
MPDKHYPQHAAPARHRGHADAEASGVPEGLEIPAEQWFEPAEGLMTVRGLLNHLRADPSGVRNIERVISDLEATEQVLVAAADQGVCFHLAVDF